MSKSIRIKDYLYEEIQRLADSEHRSLVGQLELLLEQALRLPSSGTGGRAKVSSDESAARKGLASVAPRPETVPEEMRVTAAAGLPEQAVRIMRGECGMNVPAGTKCKVCGKVHPL